MDKWIFVKDIKELPLGQRVFICFEKKERQCFTVGALCFQTDPKTKERDYFVFDESSDDIVDKVVAYMPFPKNLKKE